MANKESPIGTISVEVWHKKLGELYTEKEVKSEPNRFTYAIKLEDRVEVGDTKKFFNRPNFYIAGRLVEAEPQNYYSNTTLSLLKTLKCSVQPRDVCTVLRLAAAEEAVKRCKDERSILGLNPSNGSGDDDDNDDIASIEPPKRKAIAEIDLTADADFAEISDRRVKANRSQEPIFIDLT